MGDSADEGNLIQFILNDLKATTPVWEDLVGKANKLNSALKTTVVAADGFFDTFQRIADVALSSRGRVGVTRQLVLFWFFSSLSSGVDF
ncbi:PREDICTED: metastasis suppressor protein 1-like [Acropora digitifera]|uniref:metastasis suppressor protein 1-like n=1 Tax=Acropora digitifera TaxID=70779 RepID=UPI00077A04C3|nr:PREDICTED: metastasis suppressor protein 1-like [Acropora digitifera]